MKKIMAVTVAIMAVATVSQAALIAYEGFDYASGQDLSKTTQGGTGWDTVGYGDYEPGYQQTWNSDPTTVAVVSGSLTGPTGFAASAGNSIQPGGAVGDASRHVSLGADVDMSQNGAVVYFSYLFNASNMADQGTGSAGVRLNLGGYLYVSETGSNPRLRAYAGGGSVVYNWGNMIANDTTYLMVGKYWNDGGMIKMSGNWFKDGDSLAEPATWMIEASTAYVSQEAYRVEFMGSANNTLDATIDEFRMGTTFDDVIPEPATIGLFGLAAAAMLVLRKFQI